MVLPVSSITWTDFQREMQRSGKISWISRKPNKGNKWKFEINQEVREFQIDVNIPKNSLTIAADPRRVMISLVAVLEAISTLQIRVCEI